jgi:hypothetical protein
MYRFLALTMGLMLFGGTAVQAQQVGAAVRVSTLGLGAEVATQIAPGINARIGLNGLTVEYDGTEDDIEYNFDFELFSAAVLLDWHALGGGFRLSGGFLLNGNKINADAVPSDTYTIGDQEYAGSDVGRLNGKLDFNSFAPYIGLGWGDLVGQKRNLGLVLDIGLAFQGSPKVKLNAAGLIAGDAGFQADLAREQDQLEEDLDDFGIYPVASLGLRYSF